MAWKYQVDCNRDKVDYRCSIISILRQGRRKTSMQFFSTMRNHRRKNANEAPRDINELLCSSMLFEGSMAPRIGNGWFESLEGRVEEKKEDGKAPTLYRLNYWWLPPNDKIRNHLVANPIHWNFCKFCARMLVNQRWMFMRLCWVRICRTGQQRDTFMQVLYVSFRELGNLHEYICGLVTKNHSWN